MQQWPNYQVFKVKEEDDYIGLQLLDLAFVRHEIEWHFAEIEFEGKWIVLLDFIRPDKKLPAFLPEPAREIVIIRNPVMEYFVRDEKNALHNWMRVELSRNILVTHEPHAEQAEQFAGMLTDFH